MTILPKDVHTAYALFQVCVIINKKELSCKYSKNTFMHNSSFYITLIKSFPRLTAHLSAFAKIKQPPPDFYTNLCPQLEQNFAPFVGEPHSGQNFGALPDVLLCAAPVLCGALLMLFMLSIICLVKSDTRWISSDTRYSAADGCVRTRFSRNCGSKV